MSDEKPVSKDEYREAMSGLETIIGTSPVPLKIEAQEAMKQVDRFAGNLRRQIASLKRLLAETSTDNTNRKEECQRIRDALSAADRRIEVLRKEQDNKAILAKLQEEAYPPSHITDDFTWVKVKCLACSLHFMIATYNPEQHTKESVHCPECGNHAGPMMVWTEPGRGFIFQNVPGRNAILRDTKL